MTAHPTPDRTTEVGVTALSGHADPDAALEEYHRVDAAAFGLTPNPAQLASKRAMIDLDRWYLATIDGVACGGAGSFRSELTLPGGATPRVAAVSDVGVVPTHRRRGVLSALMRRQLLDCSAAGLTMAVLHASEGSIYRRFGYGPATRWRELRVDARRVRFRDDWPDPGGSFEVSTLAAADPELRAVHDRVRRARPGGLSRDDAWWSVVTGAVESYLGGSPRRLAMLHRDRDGVADGYAVYEVEENWSSGQANHSLAVWELVGATTGVELSLWRSLISHDLVATVTGAISVDDALWDVVVDARQVGLRWEQDLLWVRLLDVDATLSARTYAGPGEIVFEVNDPFLGLAAGCHRLVVDRDGTAECAPVDGVPDLSLDVSELSSCVLGGTSWRRLARAGRLREHTEEASTAADRLFGVDPLPWCWVRF